MKSLIKLLLLFQMTTSSVIATPIDEALLDSAYGQGVNIYNTCIAIPPVSPQAVSYCTTIYSVYVATLTELNAPYALVSVTNVSPYAWSPFDICRYEVTQMVFNLIAEAPYYCPSI